MHANIAPVRLYILSLHCCSIQRAQAGQRGGANAVRAQV
jgi:hypothetical protein